MKNKNAGRQRKIDESVKKTIQSLGSNFTLISKMEIKSWKAYLISLFFAGFAAALIFSVQTNIQTRSAAKNSSSGKAEKNIKAASELDFVKDRILVKFKDKADKVKVADFIEKNNLKEKFEIKQIKVKALSVPPGKTAPEMVEKLKKEGKDLVEFAELDRIHPPVMVPNDTNYSSQWHHPVINSPAAWDNTQGSGVTIAILDSGVDPTHPDLAGSLVAGYNFYDNNTSTVDVYGHGTKVAGSAAAIGNNSSGVAGVAWKASIMPIRVTDTTGYAYTSTLSNGLVWSADHGAKAMNMSFAGVAGISSITTAAQYARDKGAVVVAAAGNCSCDDSTPENSSMVSVGATDSSDALASFSSRGSYVDLSAPGSGIYTTVNGGSYGAVSGTSFASPVTAGVVGLIFSAKPSLTPGQVESILFNTAHDLGTSGKDNYFGWGRIDAAAAVNMAMGGPPPSDTISPTVSITSPANSATVSGTTTVSASASDNVGVTKVEFYVDGSLQTSDTTSPYSFSWDTTKTSNGSHTLSAKAYDGAGNIGTSASVAVTVSNSAPGDTTAPTVTMTSPANNAVFTKSMKINATANDNVGVVSMTGTIDGRQVCSSTSRTLSCNVSLAKKYAKGSHAVAVVAADAAGNKGTATVNVVFQ